MILKMNECDVIAVGWGSGALLAATSTPGVRYFAYESDQYDKKLHYLGQSMGMRSFDRREQSDCGTSHKGKGIFIIRKVPESASGSIYLPYGRLYFKQETIRKNPYQVALCSLDYCVRAPHVQERFIRTRLCGTRVRKWYKWGFSPVIRAR